jgi:hypothetical protein
VTDRFGYRYEAIAPEDEEMGLSSSDNKTGNVPDVTPGEKINVCFGR